MNPDLLIGRLEHFAYALPNLVKGIPEVEARWRPSDGGWSILEVVCHLGDEEEHDFRRRLELLLTDPERPWPRVNVDEMVEEGNYNERDLARECDRFQRERLKSVRWLRSTGTADWTATKDHPKLGLIRAGDLLASWAAHDALHLRQIARRLYDLANRDAPGFSTSYAGKWQ